MKTNKRLWAMILSVVIVIELVPLAANAESTGKVEYTMKASRPVNGVSTITVDLSTNVPISGLQLEFEFDSSVSVVEKTSDSAYFRGIKMLDPDDPTAIVGYGICSVVITDNQMTVFLIDSSCNERNQFGGQLLGSEILGFLTFDVILDSNLSGDSFNLLKCKTMTDTKVADSVFTFNPKTLPSAPSAPTVESKTASSVTLVAVEGYEYRMDDGEWQTSNVFEGLMPNTEYSFCQRVAETETSYESDASEAAVEKTLKNTVEAPSAPTVESKTASSVTLVAVEGYEYRVDGGEWQTSNVFEGLMPNTEYSFYQRVAETENAYASDSSSALSVRTDSAAISGDIYEDGNVDIVDSMLLFYHVAKKTTLSDDEISRCELTGDGAVDIVDSMKLFYFVAKKIPSLD
ncbi:MAG: hypothetical protein PUA50_04860 [Eubacteriales bacterium]|nr:hypothetical protein [Eubacteriales bacterium]